MKRVLVTGADGFTGWHLLPKLRSAGYEVWAGVRSSARLPLPGAPRTAELDLSRPETLRAALAAAQPDAIIHLAAISQVGQAPAHRFYEVNTLGTQRLLDAVVHSGLRPNMLLASSGAVYGAPKRSGVIAESAPLSPGSHYAASKAAMEMAAHAYMAELPCWLLRPFNYTGPGQSARFLVPKLVEHFREGAAEIRLGNTHVEREFSDVSWVCDAYIALLQLPGRGSAVNICTGQGHSIQGLIERLVEMTGHRPQIVRDPHLVREGEPVRVVGDNSCLRQWFDAPAPDMGDTLQRMLSQGDV